MALPAGRRGIRANLVKSDGTISDLTKLKEDFAALNASDISTIDVPLFKSLTGNPVTISDAVGENAKCAKATLEPIQDLHGYDHPWAGGAGKNLFDIEGWLTSIGVSYTKNGNAYTITMLDDTAFENSFVFSDTDTLVTLSLLSFVTGTAVSPRIQLLDANNRVIGTLNDNTSPLQIKGTASKVRLDYSKAGTFTIECPQIETGDTATSYEPYSNICPVSGRTQVEITNKDSEDVEQASVTVDLGQTVYGGTLKVTTGELTVETANITFYNGESIGEPWWSSMDEYVAGTTPTTGAQVVYTLATPTTVSLTPAQIQLLTTTNIISTNADALSIMYRSTEEGNVEGALQYLFDKIEELSAQINE